MIAATPTYARAGAIPWCGLARMLQGLSVGGEYGASATYLSEMAMRNPAPFGRASIYHADRRTAVALSVVVPPAP
jgi:MFS family permease